MNQKEYKIGSFRFIPERRLLICEEKELKHKLDGKQTSILYFFVKHPNVLITRESLIANIWQRDFVADHAINTKISELRKILRDDYKNPKYLKTHHQRGYELVAQCELIPAQQPTTTLVSKPVTAHNHTKTSKIAVFSIATLAIIVTIIAGMTMLNTKKIAATPSRAELVPITTERGQEWSPSLSRDGRFLSYSHRKNESANLQLKVKELSTHKITTITTGLFNATSPIWGNNSTTLYFIKSIQGKCEIWHAQLMPDGVNNHQINHVTDCGSQVNSSSLALSEDNEWLYYAKFYQNNKANIQRINLKSDAIEILTTTTASEKNYNLALSNDNTKLAYLKSNLTTNTKIIVLDLISHKIIFEQKFMGSPHHISWNKSDTKINYIDLNNNLTQINIKSKTTEIIAKFQQKMLYPYLANNNQFYVVDGEFYSSEIISIPLEVSNKSIEIKPEVYSSYSDTEPTLDPTSDAIAFTSNRSNTDQIWLKKGNQQYSLTAFPSFSLVTDKHYSPDGKYIVFLRNGKPYIYDVNQTTIIELDSELNSARSPIWSCDGNIIYLTSRVNNMWRLYAISLNTLRHTKIHDNTLTVKSDCESNQYYSVQPNTHTILKHPLDFKNAYITQHILLGNNMTNWQIHNKHLYQLFNDKLFITDLKSNQRTTIKLPEYKYFSFNISNKRIYLSRKIFQETKIKQLVNIKV